MKATCLSCQSLTLVDQLTAERCLMRRKAREDAPLDVHNRHHRSRSAFFGRPHEGCDQRLQGVRQAVGKVAVERGWKRERQGTVDPNPEGCPVTNIGPVKAEIGVFEVHLDSRLQCRSLTDSLSTREYRQRRSAQTVATVSVMTHEASRPIARPARDPSNYQPP